jgi:hypothetical protein
MFISIIVDDVFENVATQMTGSPNIDSVAVKNLLKNGTFMPQLKMELLQEIPKVMLIKNLQQKLEKMPTGTDIQIIKSGIINILEADSKNETIKQIIKVDLLWYFFIIMLIVVAAVGVSRYYTKKSIKQEIIDLFSKYPLKTSEV